MSKYIVVFSLDTGLLNVEGVYDDYEAALGCALLSLDTYARENMSEEYELADMYVSTLYRIEGDSGFGMTLMGRGDVDKELADVWILDYEG